MPVTLKDNETFTPAMRAAEEAAAWATLDGSRYGPDGEAAKYRGFVRMMERKSSSKGANNAWTNTYTVRPYMETAGRLAEANDDGARPMMVLRSWLNDTDEPIWAPFQGEQLLVPARHAKAVFIRRILMQPGPDIEQLYEADEAIRHSDKGVDATHSLANAQTSAIGRVLGDAGYGLLPNSSISPAETMSTTPQDDPAPEAKAEPKPKAPAKKAKEAELTDEQLQGIMGHLKALGEVADRAALVEAGKAIAQDQTIVAAQADYLRIAYAARRDELLAAASAPAPEAPTADAA